MQRRGSGGPPWGGETEAGTQSKKGRKEGSGEEEGKDGISKAAEHCACGVKQGHNLSSFDK